MDLQPYNARLEKLFNEVAAIQHYQRLTANIAKQTIADLEERANNLANMNAEAREVFGRSAHLFSFYSPYTGAIHPYSHKTLTLEETARLVHLHKNKQYQWLLVEAYELFEDFVVSLYEYIRRESTHLRLGKDGEATMLTPELKKKVPLIIDMFRKKLPDLAKIEVENKTDTNLRLHALMAERFRHVIVHKNGRSDDPEGMVNGILKRSNLAGDKARESAARAEISKFLGTGDLAGVIVLVEQPVFRSAGISMDINRHENLVNSLMAHALVIAQSLVNHIGAT